MASVRILGPVEAFVEERRLSLGGSRQVKLFSFLVLHANRPVSRDAVTDAVWGSARTHSDHRLPVAISRLRKALEPLSDDAGSRLRTVGGGYMLSLAPGELDAEVFAEQTREARRALDAGDPAQASQLLSAALDLWRGAPLAQVAFEDFAQAEIRRLEELYLVALETRIDADLKLGHHAELIGELEGLLARQPARERVAGQLMTALYRSGRQADALAVYQSARRELVEELGIEPGPSLRELEQSILRQDPGLDVAPHPLVDQGADAPPGAVEPLHNLPARVSSFVGRERELVELQGLLSQTRALTLVGAGGVGKTRLALELAELVLEGWGDGAWFVDLAPLADPTLVVSKVASIFGVPETQGRPQSRSLVAWLRSQELIVILDNCEHVIDAAAMLAEQLVTGCPRVAVLATSREPLRIAGEQVYRVPSLSLPAGGEDDPECLRDSEAVRLFVDRARQQRPGFELDSRNRGCVARLCHRLDGIPLAIELAAARLRSIALGEIETRLDQRFALLAGGNRTAPPRQQTLEALIDWSYSLLSPGEQDVLQRLSVFAGGFDLEAAEIVAARGRDGSVLDELVALVDKSLVEWDGTNDRYRLLESVREYAADKLEARGPDQATAARSTHRDHYLTLAEMAAPHLVAHAQLQWLDRLELELDNLRVAISECKSDPDPEPGLRLTSALRYFWAYRDPRAEGAHSLCVALDRADAQASTLLRGQALAAAAHLVTKITRRHDDAAARAREALSIADVLPDERLRADALARLLEIASYRGDEEMHEALCARAFGDVQDLSDPHLKAQLLALSVLSPRVPRSERVRTLEEGLALARQTGDQPLQVRILADLGYDAMEVAEVRAARSYFDEAAHLVLDIGDPQGLLLSTCNLGFASYLDGADTDARRLFDETLRMARRTEDLYMTAYAQLGLALLTSRAGDAHDAATLHGVADAIHEKLGTSVDPVESRLRAADITALRDLLGNEAFEHAYGAGQRLEADSELALT